MASLMTAFAGRLAFSVALLSFALNSTAWAHTHLVSATAASVTSAPGAPRQVTLTFSEPVELTFSGVVIMGPDQTRLSTGAVAAVPGDATRLVVPVLDATTPGPWTIKWHAVGADGHKSNGTYTLTLKP
jgi:copper resistance protein C